MYKTAVQFVLLVLSCFFVAVPAFPQATEKFQQGINAFAVGDYQTAADIWLVEAYEGSPDAQFNLGVMYIEGKGVPQNRDDALFWFIKAAENDHIQAQYNLGHLYFEDNDNPESLKKGAAWWRRSSLQGFSIAQFNYARAVFYGFGVEQNLPEALYWLEQSAASGEDVALRFLDAQKDAFAGVVADRGPMDTLELSTVIAQSEQAENHMPVSQAGLGDGAASAPQAVSQPDTTTSSETVLPYHVTVTGQHAIIFSAPGDLSPVLLEVKTDVFPEFLLRVVAVSGEWLEVNVPGGFPVWIGKDRTRVQGRLVEVTKAKQLYARDRVSGETTRLKEVSGNTKLMMLDEMATFYKVLAPQELTGWINKSQVTRPSAAEIDLARQWQDLVILRKSAPALSSAPEPGSGEDDGVDNNPVDGVLPTVAVESGELPGDQSVSSQTESVARANPSSLTVDEFVTQLENRVGIALEVEPHNQKPRVHNDNQWLFSRNAEHFTLQLFRIKDRDKALILYEEVKNSGQLFSTVTEGTRWYFVLLGDFESQTAVLEKLMELPNWARLGAVKSFSILQAQRCEKVFYLANYERVDLDQNCRT